MKGDRQVLFLALQYIPRHHANDMLSDIQYHKIIFYSLFKMAENKVSTRHFTVESIHII